MSAAKRWHQPLVAEAFCGWRAEAQHRSSLRQRLAAAMYRWQGSHLAKAFETWRYQESLGGGQGIVCASEHMTAAAEPSPLLPYMSLPCT